MLTRLLRELGAVFYCKTTLPTMMNNVDCISQVRPSSGRSDLSWTLALKSDLLSSPRSGDTPSTRLTVNSPAEGQAEEKRSFKPAEVRARSLLSS